MEQLHVKFGVSFICVEDDGEHHGTTCTRLKANIQDPEEQGRLQMQLAVSLEFGRQFANATYKLEGDGELCLQAYEVICSPRQIIEANPIYLPSTIADSGPMSWRHPRRGKQHVEEISTGMHSTCEAVLYVV